MYLLVEVFRVRRCNFSQLFIESKSAWRLVRSSLEESGRSKEYHQQKEIV